MKLFSLLPLVTLGQESCEAQWESKIKDLLDETKSLMAVLETASTQGLNGNYVARITTAMNNARSNFDQCDSIDVITESVNRIQRSESTCNPNDLNGELNEIRQDSISQRGKIENLVSRYESSMDHITQIQLSLKNNVYVNDVFGKGRILITEVMNIFEAIKQNVEVDTVQLTKEAKVLRENTEADLKELEEKYKYISHDVDILIYSIEPIIALLGIGEFNEVLCGTDIELGCDDEHGGVLCNTCGQNSNNQGANGLIHQADDVIDATRQTLEQKIYQARKFIDSVPDNLPDEAQEAMENTESMYTRQIDSITQLVTYAEHLEKIVKFLTNFDKVPTPNDILKLADDVLSYDPFEQFGEPTDLDSFWRNRLDGFDPSGRETLNNDELSDYYRAARDSKLVHNKAAILLRRLKQTIKTSQAVASGQVGVNAEEVSKINAQLQELTVVMQSGIDKLRADYLSNTDFDDTFERYTKLFDMVKGLTTQMQQNLDRLDVIYQEYEEYKDENQVDELINSFAKFESLELRSEQLVNNVSALKVEMNEKFEHIQSLQKRVRENDEEMKAQLSEIHIMKEEALKVRRTIHKAHNTECKELYA